MPIGVLNLAEVPVPSVDPEEEPARVVTTPLDISTLRILLLEVSAI